MICEFCEGHTVKKRVTKLHWFQHNLYMIEGVEAEVCAECGERYFHATVLERIDTVLEREHIVKKNIAVEVVNLEDQHAINQ